MNDPQPTAKSSRRLGWVAARLGILWFILYCCYLVDPFVTFWIGLAVTALFIVGVILSQFRRRSSLKLVVIVIPILIALACIPIRSAMESRRLMQTLTAAGIYDFQVLPDENWRWAGSVIRNNFDTELVSVQLELAQLDQSKLDQIPTDGIRFVSIYAQEPSERLEKKIVDWIAGCPMKPTLSMHLFEPSSEELKMLRRLPNEMMLDWQSSVLSQKEFDCPELTHLHLKYSDIEPTYGMAAKLPKLKSLLLYDCKVADGKVLKNLKPQVHFKVFSSQITHNASALFETSSPHLNISKHTFAEEISLPVALETLPEKNTIMFQYCQLSDKSLLEIMRARRSSKLLLTDCSPLKPATIQKLLEMSCIEELILGGSWIKIEHLQSLRSRKTAIQIGLERLTIDADELVRLKAELPAHVKLAYARTQEP